MKLESLDSSKFANFESSSIKNKILDSIKGGGKIGEMTNHLHADGNCDVVSIIYKDENGVETCYARDIPGWYC